MPLLTDMETTNYTIRAVPHSTREGVTTPSTETVSMVTTGLGTINTGARDCREKMTEEEDLTKTKLQIQD